MMLEGRLQGAFLPSPWMPSRMAARWLCPLSTGEARSHSATQRQSASQIRGVEALQWLVPLEPSPPLPPLSPPSLPPPSPNGTGPYCPLLGDYYQSLIRISTLLRSMVRSPSPWEAYIFASLCAAMLSWCTLDTV